MNRFKTRGAKRPYHLEKILKILIVCTGNTCRSPMAECYLKDQHPGWDVASAGIATTKGQQATVLAQEVMAERNLSLAEHRSRAIADFDLASYDHVLAMTPRHLEALEGRGALLSSLRGENDPVPDPYGGVLSDYQDAFERIKYYLDGLGQSVSALISPKVDYGARALNAPDLHEDPMDTFKDWLAEAVSAKIPEANATCLCTVDDSGCPDGRIVLLKGVEREALIFYTNYESNKAEQIDHSGQASMVFWWQALKRQVRFKGRVEKVEEELSDEYFGSRDRSSQLGAWASLQSRPMADRDVLEQRLAEFEEKYPKEVPRPPSWGGFRLIPDRAEFWQGRSSRLHDRFVYRRESLGSWSLQRLMP